MSQTTSLHYERFLIERENRLYLPLPDEFTDTDLQGRFLDMRWQYDLSEEISGGHHVLHLSCDIMADQLVVTPLELDIEKLGFLVVPHEPNDAEFELPIPANYSALMQLKAGSALYLWQDGNSLRIGKVHP